MLAACEPAWCLSLQAAMIITPSADQFNIAGDSGCQSCATSSNDTTALLEFQSMMSNWADTTEWGWDAHSEPCHVPGSQQEKDWSFVICTFTGAEYVVTGLNFTNFNFSGGRDCNCLNRAPLATAILIDRMYAVMHSHVAGMLDTFRLCKVM